MSLKSRFSLLLAFGLLAGGCTTTAPESVVDAQQLKTSETDRQKPLALELVDISDFQSVDSTDTETNIPNDSEIPSPQQIFDLSDEAKTHFFAYLNHSANARYPMHKRVFNYLNRHLSNFNYYSDTYTAQQTLENNSGNCMSLAILTTAYADLAGLEFQYNRVDSAPVFGRAGRFEVASTHVVTKLFDPTFIPKPGMLYVRKPYLLVDYFPTRNNWVGGKVTKDTFVAMFYRNLAAQRMAEEDFNSAGRLAIAALKHAPYAVDGINTMAVIYRQIGRDDKAEALYRYGLTLTENNIDLLYNYQLLLSSQGRNDESTKLQARLEQLDDPSPFPYLRLADEALARSDVDLALKFYNKTIDKAHYLPHGYVGAAKAYFAKGKFREARKQLHKAIERTHDGNDEKLFRAKLASLTD